MTWDWNFDVDTAKRHDGYMLLAITGPKSGQMVLRSRWLPAEQRFECISAEKNRVWAWLPWPDFPALPGEQDAGADDEGVLG